jgi:hypothetical protein
VRKSAKICAVFGQEITEEHARPIERVVFRGDKVRRAHTVPIERCVEDRLHEIAVGHVVGPLPLTLEAGGDGMMSLRFFPESHFGQLRIANHEIARDKGHLHGCFPLGIESLAGALGLGRVPIFALLAMGFHPFERLGKFGFVVNPPLDAADEFDHVQRLDAHAEPMLEKRGVDDRSGDAHRSSTHGEVGAAAHRGRGETSADEAQNFLLHVGGNFFVARVLDVLPVNPEGRQAFLRMAGQHRSKINRSRTLGAVETPHGLGGQRVGIHRLRAVTPAGCDGERDTYVFLAEFFRAGRSLSHAADAGVGHDALDPFAGRIAQFGGDEFGRGLGHAHRLGFERFTHAAETAVDRRANADFGEMGEDRVGHGEVFSAQCSDYSFSVLKFKCADWS